MGISTYFVSMLVVFCLVRSTYYFRLVACILLPGATCHSLPVRCGKLVLVVAMWQVLNLNLTFTVGRCWLVTSCLLCHGRQLVTQDGLPLTVPWWVQAAGWNNQMVRSRYSCSSRCLLPPQSTSTFCPVSLESNPSISNPSISNNS